MVLPLVAWGAVALVGAVVGGSYVYDKWWNRKTITVLGGRGVGKTTLLNYFRTKKVNTSYEQTDTKERYPSMTIEIDGLSLKIKEGYDVGGSAMNHSTWREQVNESDVVFYIVDTSRIMGKGKNEQYISNTLSDIKAISDNVSERKEKISIFILATHADKFDEFQTDRQSFEKKLSRSQIIGNAEIEFGGTNYCKVIIGSLKNNQEAEKLVKNILLSIDK